MQKRAMVLVIVWLGIVLIACGGDANKETSQVDLQNGGTETDTGSDSTSHTDTDEGDGSGEDSSQTGIEIEPTSCECGSIGEPVGETETVSTVAALEQAVQTANQNGGGITILIKDGTYDLNNTLYITAPGITFRSESQERAAVVLRGRGMDGNIAHVFLIAASNITVADLTLGWVANHGIQVQGEHDADHILIHNVRFVDTNEQMLKVSADSTDTSGDNGIVRCSLFEYSAGIGPQYYIGGIDCHKGIGWQVYDNVFKHIRSPESDLAEHAIHFWSFARDTLVERNIIMDCDRGIGFGLGESGHIGGIIRNNMVHTTRDVGIGLESASNVDVYHNTVYTLNYDNSIEYRFSGTTGCDIRNNLTNAAIAGRNGGAAVLDGNYDDAEASYFKQTADLSNVDLHLSGEIAAVVDQASDETDVDEDIDCQSRTLDAAPDIGADEL